MSPLEQLRIQVRTLEARIAALERRRSKRVAAPRPDARVIGEREKLWAKYFLLDVARRGRITKLAFAIRHCLNPDEFCRWFSATDKRGIPSGSDPDLRFRKAVTDAIAELEARTAEVRAPKQVVNNSRGKMTHSQFFAARPQ